MIVTKKEKYKTFSIAIIDREVNNKTINYNLRFIDSDRFMQGSLDAHVNNLSELYGCNCSDKKKQKIKIKYTDESRHARHMQKGQNKQQNH